MSSIQNSTISHSKHLSILNVSLILLSTLLFFYFKPYYLPLNFSLFLGIIFAPFLFRIIDNQSNHRFLIAACLIGIVLLFIKTNTLYYLLWVCVVLSLIENWKGRLNNLPLFLFFIISYLSQQILNNWSFPIRLKLSELAGKTIGYLGYETEIIGNVIHLDGIPFSVDPACMGLKMMVTAQLLGLVILAFFEHKKKIVFSIPKIGISLVLVMGLTVLANFTRIIALVIFYILPENPLHELIGIICLIFYVLIPFYFIIKFFTKERKNRFFPKKLPLPPSNSTRLAPKIVLLIILLFHGLYSKQKVQAVTTPYPIETMVGFRQSQTKHGILKLENEQTLIYIKPPVSFFQGSHDPRICWSGSGYEFTNIKIEKIGTIEIYTALLKNKKEQLYTAWWYDNLQSQTIEEWQWRMERLNGQDGYYLVNVSCLDPVKLMDQVKQLLQ